MDKLIYIFSRGNIKIISDFKIRKWAKTNRNTHKEILKNIWNYVCMHSVTRLLSLIKGNIKINLKSFAMKLNCKIVNKFLIIYIKNCIVLTLHVQQSQ